MNFQVGDIVVFSLPVIYGFKSATVIAVDNFNGFVDISYNEGTLNHRVYSTQLQLQIEPNIILKEIL